jgi:polyhydroxyalkanoic acid synthase PhaR subunit
MSQTKEDKSFDPFEAWRDVRNSGMDTWAKSMIQLVNTEEYAKVNGAVLDAYLTASIPFREMLEKVMTQVLQQANLPSRNDFISMAERLTQIEMRLDDLEAKLEEDTPKPPPPTGPAGPRKSRRKEAK